MKRAKDYTLTALAIPAIVIVLLNLPSCEASRQPVTDYRTIDYRGDTQGEYQIDVLDDSVYLFDGQRRVATFALTDTATNPLCAAVWHDNE